jgi:hypothetical protein
VTYLAPGLYPDLSLEEYLAITDKDGWPAIRNGLLRAVRHGPRECQHRQRFGVTPTKAMLAGTLVHTQVLSPADWLRRFVEWDVPVFEPRPALKWDKLSPDLYISACNRYRLERTAGNDWRAAYTDQDDMQGCGDALIDTLGTVTAAKAVCKEHYERTVSRVPKLDDDGKPKLSPQNPNSGEYKKFVAANPDRIIVTRDEIEHAKRIAVAIRDNPEARRRLGQIWRTELTIVWEHEETGALMACRHDWLTDPRAPLVTLGELKTCRSAEEGAFNRQAADMEYHAQAAHYRAGFRAHFGEHIETESVCLAVENTGSHDNCVYTWPGGHLDAGHELNEERLQQLLEWRDYGDQTWPCRRTAAHFDFETHGRGHLLGEDGDELDWSDS